MLAAIAAAMVDEEEEDVAVTVADRICSPLTLILVTAAPDETPLIEKLVVRGEGARA